MAQPCAHRAPIKHHLAARRDECLDNKSTIGRCRIILIQYTTNGTNTQIWDVRLLQQIQHLGKHQNESPHTQNTCDKTFVGARSKQYHTKNVAHVNHGWCYKPKYIFRFKSFTNKQCICVPLIGIQQDQMCIKEHQDFNPNPVDCQAATNIGHI